MASNRKRTARRSPQTSASVWQRGRWWFVGGGVTAVIAILIVVSVSLSGPKTSAPLVAAPDLVLGSTSGQEFRVSDARGNPLLIYFSFPG